ncbi:lytic polysaccharide monooxygenase [Micromonospora sp. BRA006-A]|nr:lytic polysaccharide monooxygenase [Micromonospora sp. BRA006-A]
MAARRALAALAAVAATVPLTAAPAAAHGAPTSPLSRAAACGPEGGRAQTPACRAAVAAGAAVREWDNIRVARIDGRDRERIPDGESAAAGCPRTGDWTWRAPTGPPPRSRPVPGTRSATAPPFRTGARSGTTSPPARTRLDAR